MVQRVLLWERQDMWYSMKRQGPMAEKCCYNNSWCFFVGGFIYATFPTRQASQGTFLTSIWCDDSWEACPPFMCLDHIITHETYHFFHAPPLKLAPTCFIRQYGTSRTREFECIFVFLVYQPDMFRIWGLVISSWKGLQNIFPMVYYTPHKY